MRDAQVARRQNGLEIQYQYDAAGRIARKTEQFNGASNVLEYAYDAEGRLTEVKNNAVIAETYKYSASGQRVRSKVWYEGCPSASTSAMEKSRYSYNDKGQLESDGQNRYAYDKYGSVSSIAGKRGLRLAYGSSTMLGRAELNDGCELRYAYKGTRLYRRYRHNDITGEYRWNDQARLAGFRDHELRLEYGYAYDADGTLSRIVIRPLGKTVLDADAAPVNEHNGSDGWLHWFCAANRKERVCQCLSAYQQFRNPSDAGKPEKPALGGAMTGSAPAGAASALSSLVLACCCDHLGTPRLFVGPDGKVVKEVVRSSFGKIVYDSLPCLYVPIGFCAGLEDRDTHLIRFNWRAMIRALADLCRLTLQTTRAAMVTCTTIAWMTRSTGTMSTGWPGMRASIPEMQAVSLPTRGAVCRAIQPLGKN
ncbi:MAG: RHS repeat protein [Desulfovibrio desulfuricans]|nr:RHS repeat protein [Desulfovibrio desulfuricans]